MTRKITRILAVHCVLCLIAACSVPSCAYADIVKIDSAPAVIKRVCDNGLTILAAEMAGSGLVSIHVKLNAGSSLEGEWLGSGISHFVEHMVFKGTPSRKMGDIPKAVEGWGGTINATTGEDVADYRITVPVEHFKDALALLCDMLTNAVFDPAECEKERGVILKEINLHNDDPSYRTMALLNETAYTTHPYKYPPIGFPERFMRLTREDLMRYYACRYLPNNMVLSAAGDMRAQDMLQAMEEAGKTLRPPAYAPTVLPVEPEQVSPREADKEADTPLAYYSTAFHTVSLLDRDLFALDVLAMILGSGVSSRLYAVIVRDEKIAYSVSVVSDTPRSPGLFYITATLEPDKMALVEKRVAEIIAGIKKGGVDVRELEEAKRKVLSGYIFSREGIDGIADGAALDEIMTGDRYFSKRYVDGISRVSQDDVVRVARRYLVEDGATTVRLFPRGTAERFAESKDAGIRTTRIKKSVLPNGVTVLVRENTALPTVAITIVGRGGMATEDAATNGITNLVSGMILKGTKTRKETEIVGAIERLGGRISSSSGFNNFGINMSLLKGDFDAGMAILHDVFTNATFPQDELDAVKMRIYAEIRQQDNDVFQRGSLALRRALFGNHPYGLRMIGEEKSVRSVTRAQLIDWYKRYFVSGNTIISISGDIDTDSAVARCRELFGAMAPGQAPDVKPARAPGLSHPQKIAIELNKEQSVFFAGFRTVGMRNEAYFPLSILGAVEGGFSGRLFPVLRDETPLAYTFGCQQKSAVDDGYFVAYVATTKEKLGRARDELMRQIDMAARAPVGEDELQAAKLRSKTAQKTQEQSNAYFAMNAATYELYGFGYEFIYSYGDAVGKVTARDIFNAAKHYLDRAHDAEVVVAPKDAAR